MEWWQSATCTEMFSSAHNEGRLNIYLAVKTLTHVWYNKDLKHVSPQLSRSHPSSWSSRALCPRHYPHPSSHWSRVTGTLASHWSRVITWPGQWPLIGWHPWHQLRLRLSLRHVLAESLAAWGVHYQESLLTSFFWLVESDHVTWILTSWGVHYQETQRRGFFDS